MKVFKYKFPRLTTIFIYVGIALCVAGMGVNVYAIITGNPSSAVNPIYPILQYTLMFLIPVILLVILIGLLVSSYYSIDGKILKSSFGIIKSKYEIKNIESVVLDRTTNKLSVHFADKNFITIVVREEWYDEFIDALCKANTDIEYSIKSKESDGSDGKDKNKD